MQRNILVKLALAALMAACGESGAPDPAEDTVDGGALDDAASDADVAFDGPGGDADAADVPGLPDEVVVEEVVVNDDRVCARSGNELWCWGNRLDELGEPGALRSSADPVRVREDVTAIGGSYKTFCMLDLEGAPHCISEAGSNIVGGLDDFPMTALARIPGLDSATAIEADSYHGCALASGDLHCWGWNGTGAVRPPASSAMMSPTLVKEGVLDFALASAHTCTIDTSGVVECWGTNNAMQLGTDAFTDNHTIALPAPAVSIDAAGFTTCAVTDTQDVWCWGNAYALQFGDNDARGHVRPFRTEARVRSVSVAVSSVCVVHGSGSVECAGENGSLVSNPAFPVPAVTEPATIPVLEDAESVTHAHTGCAIRRGGRLSCWGNNAYGAAGIGASLLHTEPSYMYRFRSDGSLGAGPHNTCFTTRDPAHIGCNGRNTAGILGPDEPRFRSSADLHWMPASLADSTIRVGLRHACVFNREAVACWGDNADNQCGYGTSYGVVPFGHMLPDLGGATAADAGMDHSCAALASGELSCWGNNGYTQLGRPYAQYTGSPAAADVREATNITRVATGNDITCILGDRPDQTGWHGCFGRLSYIRHTTSTPMSPDGLPSLVDLAVGDQHVCVLSEDGEVFCYGDNALGQAAPSEAASLAGPVAVEGLPGPASSVSAGGTHSCALVDGVPWCWGDNRHGQLGRTALEPSLPPAPVTLPARATEIALGTDHSVVWLDDDTIWGWGSNSHGKLGIETDIHYVLAPDEVRFVR